MYLRLRAYTKNGNFELILSHLTGQVCWDSGQSFNDTYALSLVGQLGLSTNNRWLQNSGATRRLK